MSATSAAAWLLAARDPCYADLYTITLGDGRAWHITSADRDLAWAGTTYACTGIVVSRGSFQTALAVQVQTLALTITPDRDAPELAGLVEALDFSTLRGARVTWRGWYGDSWDAAAFTVLEFSGRVADVSDEEATTLNCYDDLALLNTSMPRNVYSSTCLWQVYEPGCGVLKAAHTDAVWAAAGGTRQAVVLASSSRAPGYFYGGGLQVTSGAQQGVQVSVRLHVLASGVHLLLLTTPLDAPLQAGDTLNVWAGCDRAQATCRDKFSNVVNFRGMPYIPTPETAA